MKLTLNNLNKQSFNNFMLRIGLYMPVFLYSMHHLYMHFLKNISIDIFQVSIKEEF